MDKRKHLLEYLHGELGVCENPPGSNIVKYNDWYHESNSGYRKNPKPYAWCGVFCSFALHFSNIYVETDVHKALVYVPKAQNVLIKKGMKTNAPQGGDIVIFDWPSNPGFEEHIGFFVEMQGDYAICIEGNTSPDEKGSQSNGGMVCLKKRHISLIEGFYNVIGD